MFYGFLGWVIFWLTLVLGVIIFAKKRKYYPLFYLISAALYVYTAGFMIDVYNFGKLGILTTLVVSAVIFMIIGYYLSKVLGDGKE